MGRGKLVFKGEEKAKKKKKSSVKKQSGEYEATMSSSAGGPSSTMQQQQRVTDTGAAPIATVAKEESAASMTNKSSSAQIVTPKISNGQGLLTTSGTVVSGFGTAFKSQLRSGDAILICNEKGIEEMRVITMVLGDISISVSSAFSCNIKTPSPFKYISKPRNDMKEKAMKVAKARQEKEAIEHRAMGTYGGEKEIIYREKTEQGSYRIKREKASEDMGRSDLLAVRAKKKSDRYC